MRGKIKIKWGRVDERKNILDKERKTIFGKDENEGEDIPENKSSRLCKIHREKFISANWFLIFLVISGTMRDTPNIEYPARQKVGRSKYW